MYSDGFVSQPRTLEQRQDTLDQKQHIVTVCLSYSNKTQDGKLLISSKIFFFFLLIDDQQSNKYKIHNDLAGTQKMFAMSFSSNLEESVENRLTHG